MVGVGAGAGLVDDALLAGAVVDARVGPHRSLIVEEQTVIADGWRIHIELFAIGIRTLGNFVTERTGSVIARESRGTE